jgi:signal transduction histidine kinase
LLDGDALVRADPLLMQVLLRNLVDNALRHSGGTQIEVAIAQTGTEVVLAVSDNGRGIAADERERVQQRFYRSAGTIPADHPSSADGSGLGLSIVRRIAELQGGKISIVPGPSGVGVSIQLHLPRTRAG